MTVRKHTIWQLKVSKSGKELIFPGSSESEPPAKISYGKVFKGSIFGNMRSKSEHASPAFHGDLLAENAMDSIVPLAKKERPAVGFCGFVGSPLQRLGYKLAGAGQKADGLRIRAEVIKAFQHSPVVKKELICRNRYLGGATLASYEKESHLIAQRKEYLNNVFGNLYGIAVRGKGNHSVRFYEILCAGRIPIFINTDCVLPFENEINYRNHVVWIDYNQLSQAGSILESFHRRLSNDEVIQMQRNNRKLWEEYFSPIGFYRRVIC